MAISLIVLVVGGGFTLANRTAVTGTPRNDPAGPITTPGPQEDFLSFTGGNEVILAEVQETDSLWAFVVDELRKDNKPCLWSMNYATTEQTGGRAEGVDVNDASGVGDCVPLGVPDSRHLGFYMWDAEIGDRLEVLGQVSTDVSRLELQDSHDSDGGITIIEAPEELGRERNFFFLWLPLREEGTLVAYDTAGRVLERRELCLEPGARGASCVVAQDVRSTERAKLRSPTTVEHSKESGKLSATEGIDQQLLACNKKERSSELGEGEMGVVPREALQEWLDKKSIVTWEPIDFDVERIGPEVRELSLPNNDDGYAMVAVTALVPAPSSSEIDQWRLAEVAYCPNLMGP